MKYEHGFYKYFDFPFVNNDDICIKDIRNHMCFTWFYSGKYAFETENRTFTKKEIVDAMNDNTDIVFTQYGEFHHDELYIYFNEEIVMYVDCYDDLTSQYYWGISPDEAHRVQDELIEYVTKKLNNNMLEIGIIKTSMHTSFTMNVAGRKYPMEIKNSGIRKMLAEDEPKVVMKTLLMAFRDQIKSMSKIDILSKMYIKDTTAAANQMLEFLETFK